MLHVIHYNYVIMSLMVFQITSLTIVYSIVYSSVFQRKHQSSAPLAFEWGIHRSPVNSPHKWQVTRKYFHLMTSSWEFWVYVACVAGWERCMMTSWHGNAFSITGAFWKSPRRLVVLCQRLVKLLSKEFSCLWFHMPRHPWDFTVLWINVFTGCFPIRLVLC